MKRIIRFFLSAVMAVTVLTAGVKADSQVRITLNTGEGKLLGKTGSHVIQVEKNHPLSLYFTEPGSEEVILDDDERGFKGWSFAPYGNLCYLPEELLDFCPQEDTTLYAVYDRKYTITFELGEGYYNGFHKYVKEVVRERRYDLSEIIPYIYDGSKAFYGWNLSSGASGFHSYDAVNLAFSGDMTFTAQYAESVTVRFYAGEGYFEDEHGNTFAIKEMKAPKGQPCQFVLNAKNNNTSRELTDWRINSTSDTIWNPNLKYKVFNEDTDCHAVWNDCIPITKITMATGVKVAVGDRVEVPVDVVPFVNNGYALYAASNDASIARITIDGTKMYVTGISVGKIVNQIYAGPLNHSLTASRPFIIEVYSDGDPAACKVFGFCWYRGRQYWYEGGVRQGIMGDPRNITDTVYGYERGREIYDPDSNGWYWLDAIYDGAKAQSKEVWMPYIYQSDLAAGINKQGKWVRYNNVGAMIKGWYTVAGSDVELYPSQAGNRYYYDLITGEMVKGYRDIDGRTYHFDENSGVLLN